MASSRVMVLDLMCKSYPPVMRRSTPADERQRDPARAHPPLAVLLDHHGVHQVVQTEPAVRHRDERPEQAQLFQSLDDPKRILPYDDSRCSRISSSPAGLDGPGVVM